MLICFFLAVSDGAFCTPPQLKQGREERGLAIPDTDVICLGTGVYNVKSQRQRDSFYTVTEFSCTCSDRLRRLSVTCKHMHKVRCIIQGKLCSYVRDSEMGGL